MFWVAESTQEGEWYDDTDLFTSVLVDPVSVVEIKPVLVRKEATVSTITMVRVSIFGKLSASLSSVDLSKVLLKELLVEDSFPDWSNPD